jgi:hypothetical protein
MRLTSDTALLLATDRLRWALDRPPRCGDREWGERMGRALASLKDALRTHAAWQESPEGLFALAVDPSLLPITPLSRTVHELRRAHADLLDRISELQHRLLDASRESASHPDSPGRAITAVFQGAQRLLAAIGDHKAAEEAVGASSLSTM